jgi:hypothetical protein
LLRQIAVPRLVGTPQHQRVREILKRELAARGFTVEEHAFTARPSWLLVGAPTVIRGINLIASRPSDRPAVRPSTWLVAHYDSKGQPISMATRIIGAAALVVGAVTALGGLAVGWMIPVAVALVAFGVGVMARNRVTDASPGAVDNASAVVAVFAILDLLPPDAAVGVLLTDAEEWGLLGARALVQERSALLLGAAVVNLDGLDDRGRTIAFLHRRGPVGRAVAVELGALRAPWLPILVDGIALARGSVECVTIMRGDWQTARVVHTPGDTAERLTLDGVRAVAAGVAAALARVLRSPSIPL